MIEPLTHTLIGFMQKFLAVILALAFISSPLTADRCWTVKDGDRYTCESLDCDEFQLCNKVVATAQTPDGETHTLIYCLCNTTSSPCCVGGFYDGLASKFGVCSSQGCPVGSCLLQVNNTPQGQKVSAICV